eukprot:jgi/Mesen1/1714/ME000138S00572
MPVSECIAHVPDSEYPTYVKARSEPTRYLYVCNCGPEVGDSSEFITELFGVYGDVVDVIISGPNLTRVYVIYSNSYNSKKAKDALHGKSCQRAGGRIMQVHYSEPVLKLPQVKHKATPVVLTAEDTGIRGLYLQLEFKLLDAVDKGHEWHYLAKRRVQHHGYAFDYTARDVDRSRPLGGLPPFLSHVVDRIAGLPELAADDAAIGGGGGGSSPLPPFIVDQLTVNEYRRGVGLAPHIDTHSSFEHALLSLSLAGPCVMEFRRAPSKGAQSPAPHAAAAAAAASTPESLSGGGGVEEDGEAEMEEEERRAVYLPPRSLLVLSGEARYAWSHYIPHHKQDMVNGEVVQRAERRVSFTFRKVRHGECTCSFPQYCDSRQSQGGSSAAPLSEPDFSPTAKADADSGVGSAATESTSANAGEADTSLLESVAAIRRDVAGIEMTGDATSTSCTMYDAIAPHFSSTRFAKWPKVAAFLHSLAPGSLVVDAGCGNGKYLGLNPECLFVGCDISPSLVAICRQQGYEVAVADALKLPFQSGAFDAAISIAVLHHLSTEQRRKWAIQELLRLVCPGGKVLITVWAREQEDQTLVSKWTPLAGAYTEVWVDASSSSVRSRPPPSDKRGPNVLSGQEQTQPNGALDVSPSPSLDTAADSSVEAGRRAEERSRAGNGTASGNQEEQEYFVPWHLPYHRAEVGGASARAVSSGLARRDDNKRAVVYNRYYHVFRQAELERLAAEVGGAKLIDSFYDKSNWCIILEKLL